MAMTEKVDTPEGAHQSESPECQTNEELERESELIDRLITVIAEAALDYIVHEQEPKKS